MIELIGDVAALTGWDKNTILNLPLHAARYFQLKRNNDRHLFSHWWQ